MEYKVERIKRHLESSINDIARDGWRVACFTEDLAFGVGLSWIVVFKRDDNWRRNDDAYDYKLVTVSGKIRDNVEKYASRGWEPVAISSSTALGVTTEYDIIFERKI